VVAAWRRQRPRPAVRRRLVSCMEVVMETASWSRARPVETPPRCRTNGRIAREVPGRCRGLPGASRAAVRNVDTSRTGMRSARSDRVEGLGVSRREPVVYRLFTAGQGAFLCLSRAHLARVGRWRAPWARAGQFIGQYGRSATRGRPPAAGRIGPRTGRPSSPCRPVQLIHALAPCGRGGSAHGASRDVVDREDVTLDALSRRKAAWSGHGPDWGRRASAMRSPLTGLRGRRGYSDPSECGAVAADGDELSVSDGSRRPATHGGGVHTSGEPG
jgi:hypothetical protein